VKLLYWLLLILAIAIGISLVAGNNEGYVLIVHPPYRLELSFNLLVLLLVGGFVLLHASLRLIDYTLRLPASVRAYKQEQHRKEGHAALLEALHALVEGRYSKAEKAAARALELGEDAGLTALVAARASHKLRQPGRRDYYLAEAERLAPQASVARLLMQAELLLDDRHYNQALQVLQQLDKIEPKHPPALRLELKVQVHLNNWEQVLATLRQLEKRDAIESWQLREVRRQAHLHLMERRADRVTELLAYWKKMPEEDRLSGRLAQFAAKTFLRAGNGKAAAEIVEMSLTQSWDSDLAELLGECASDEPLKQMQQAEHWLKEHHDDAKLLLALGNMCMRQELWGKAQSYLEASLGLDPSAAAHLALARMLEKRGDNEAAYQHYRQSLELELTATG